MTKVFGAILALFGLAAISRSSESAPLSNPIEDAIEIQEFSYLNNSRYPRGIRNNNAGNLIKTSIDWRGKIENGNDTRFEQFQTPEYGLRAMMKDLYSDWKSGQNTIRKLITEYAPSFENNTLSYIRAVSARTGFGEDEILNLSDEETMIKLAKAIVIHENGAGELYEAWYSDIVYQNAFTLTGISNNFFGV